jgi:phage terminase small subunit
VTPEQKQLFDKLTELQQRTAINVLAGMTQRAGYYAAGGTAKNDGAADSSAYEILSNPQVVAFMDAMKEEAVSAAVMTRTEAMEKLSVLARTDIKDLVEFGEYELGNDGEGNPVIQSSWRIRDSAMQDPAKMAAIAELTASKEGIKIKTHSPLSAIKQLADMQGWNAAQKIDSTVRVADDESEQW